MLRKRHPQWWAERADMSVQAIQDRWCAVQMVLNPPANADGDPADIEPRKLFPDSLVAETQRVASQVFLAQDTFRRSRP